MERFIQQKAGHMSGHSKLIKTALIFRLFFAFTVLLSVCITVPLKAHIIQACELRLGIVPQYSYETILENWSPVVTHLENLTGCQIKIETHQNIEDFAAAVYSGEYDLAYLNPYHAYKAYLAAGYVPLVRDKKKLTGVIVTGKDNAQVSLNDLKVQEIALPSPTALGASLVNAFNLKRDHDIDITPRFVKTHESGYIFVAKGLLPFAGGVRRSFESMPDMIKSRLRIIYETQEMPGHPIIVHPRISEDVRAHLVQAFLNENNSVAEMLDRVKLNEPVITDIDEYRAMFSKEFLSFVETFKKEYK